MKSQGYICRLNAIVLAGSSLVATRAALAQELTIQVGSPPPPPVALVSPGEVWHYRMGSTVAGWQTVPDASLDGSWLTGAGGFGYSNDWAPETNLCATGVGAMFNVTSTLYTRKSFNVTGPIDPGRKLLLTMDWDDGFVAYLDGVEVARFNAPGAVGTEPPSSAVATTSHESSNGNTNNSPQPQVVYDLGFVGNRLPPGTHVLAVLGLNRAADSSDLVLVAELSLAGGSQTAGGGPLFAIVNTNQVILSGTNTYAASTRVSVNGDDASFNPGTGLWSQVYPLSPGLNRLFVTALDATGNIVAATNRDVLYQAPGTSVGGVLSSDTVWDGANGTIVVTNTVIVPAGVTLRITNGAVIVLPPNASIRATTNGVVLAMGTESKPLLFAPADGATPWGDLGAFGTNSAFTLQHAEVVAGQIRPVNGGTMLMEDSIIRDLYDGREVIAGVSGSGLTLRRVYGTRFGEMDARDTPVLIEDSLLEEFSIDGLDIKGDNIPLVVSRTTVRRADPNNSNADGFDFGPGAGTVVQCLIYGFPDKGISLGGAPGTTVRDSVIYGCGSGLSVNVSTNCWFENTTISGCATGLFFRASGDISHLAGTNNIVWGNSNTIVFTGNSSLDLAFTDVQGGYPGPGNLNVDPLFVDPANADFRLAPGSPVAGAGLGGLDMGAPLTSLPVGGLPPAPFRLAAIVSGTGPIQLRWNEDADNETGFELERSLDRQNWSLLASAATGLTRNVREYLDATATVGQRYYYRVRAVNHAGHSTFSNPAAATRQELMHVVGGTLTVNTTWSPALGPILVVSNITVPTNVTLTIEPGTLVKITNTAGIRAIAGGSIRIAGTMENKAVLMPMVPGTLWHELSGQFAGSTLSIQHADISGGQITVYSNAVGLIEDSYIHHYRLAGGSTLSAPIILTHFAAPTVVRRCHVREYYETLWRNGIVTIEECLFENVHGDAVDFDSTQTGTVLRWCTFRHGTDGNVDAVDVGPGALPGDLPVAFDVRIENSMMFDFPFDKGVSVGDHNSSRGTIVSNCFIFACLSGVMAKDNCDVSVRNCTIVNNDWGFTNYNKVNPTSPTGGGITTNSYNNILWNNDVTISMVNASQLFADHNIFSNTNWPGDGNVDIDPLFVNPLQNDFRLQPASPARTAGRDGQSMGAVFPVGCEMALSHPRITSISPVGAQVVVQFWADNEKTYSLVCSDAVAGAPWVKVADVSTAALPRYLSITNSVAPANRFYRLVTPQQP
jgi:hypothetical protein